MSLKDGSKKMSKSELSDLSRINLTDNKDQIENTLKRIKLGTFGICISCGEEISEKRLLIDPTVLKCIGCN